nr:MAG TPA: hypothetical protein [Bacteriophage sp.]
MSGSLVMALIMIVTVISVMVGYGFRILVDLGACYFSMNVIMSAIINQPISEIEFLLACLFIICYTVMWSVEKIAKSNKTIDETINKEKQKMD